MNNEEGLKKKKNHHQFKDSGFLKKTCLVSFGGDVESVRAFLRLDPGSPAGSVPLTHGEGPAALRGTCRPALHFPSYPERPRACVALRRDSLSSDVKQCLLQNARMNQLLFEMNYSFFDFSTSRCFRVFHHGQTERCTTDCDTESTEIKASYLVSESVHSSAEKAGVILKAPISSSF